MLVGSGTCFPDIFLDTNSAIWCNLGVPKYIITNLKINNVMIINQQ